VLMKTPGWGDGVFSIDNTASQIVIQDLTFDSVYTPSSSSGTNEITATGVYAGGQNVTVRDNTFLNIETDVDCYRGPNGLLVENNSSPDVTGLRGYFVWMNGDNGVVLGNTVANSTRQHIMRSSYTSTSGWLIAGNNFANDVNPSDPNETPKTTINIRAGDHIFITDNTLSDDALSVGPDDSLPQSTVVSWIAIEGNTIINAQTYLHGSVVYAMVSNNVMSIETYPDITLQTIDDMGRQMGQVYVEDNTGILQGSIGSFMQIEGDSPAGIITLKNNFYSAPNLITGDDIATSLFVQSTDAGAIALSSDNIWGATNPTLWEAAGAAIYIAPAGVLQNTSFLTAGQWNSLGNVQNDQFARLSASGSNYTTTLNGVTAGAVLPAKLS
jgi:hypothetical protein